MNALKVLCADSLPVMSWKEKLAYLIHQFLAMTQEECPVEHLFEEGQYIREMRIPKDTLFIGRVHRHGHRCELVSGTVVHITEHEKKMIAAPFEMTTTPGYQMVLYAATDVIGRTYHADTGERDTEKLENEIFESVESVDALGRELTQRLNLPCLA